MKKMYFPTLVLLMLSAQTSFAALEVSEVFPNPVGTDADAEFIEIHNPGQESVALDTYSLDDKIDAGSKEYQLSGEIAGGQYLSIPYSQSKIVINNSNEEIHLLQNGISIDSVSFSSSKEGQSYTKQNGEWEWLLPSPGEGPLRGQQKSQELQVESGSSILSKTEMKELVQERREERKKEKEYPSGIQIIEALINPEGEDRGSEWIKIKNQNDQIVDLSLWQLDDIEGGSPPYILQQKIGPHEIVKIKSSDSKINLNNSGDEIRLISPDQKIKDHISYKKVLVDEVLTRKNNWKSQENLQKSVVKDEEKRSKNKEEKIALCKLKNNEVQFNEIAYNQYIELKNTTNYQLSLVGCSLSNGAEIHHFKYAKIKANGLLKIDTEILDMSLDAEEFQLHANHKLLQKIKIPQLPPGHAYAKNHKAEWKITTQLTPGYQNNIQNNQHPVWKEQHPQVYAGVAFDPMMLISDPEQLPLTAIFSFGDASKKKESVHTYAYPGTYVVIAQVFDGIHQVHLQKELEVLPYPNKEGDLIISELMPQPPRGQEEWIELHNTTRNVIDISGFTLTDLAGAVWEFPKQTLIAAGAYVVLPKSQTAIALTGSNEQITLFSPDKQIVDQVVYENAQSGHALIKTAQGAMWTKQATPAQKNILKVEAKKELQLTQVKDIGKIKEGQQLKIAGIVTAPPGTIFRSYVFLESGLPIRIMGQAPAIKKGDYIVVQGELEHIDQYRRLKVRAEDMVIQDIREDIEAIDLTDQQWDNQSLSNFAFQWVKIKGEITAVSDQQITINDTAVFLLERQVILPPPQRGDSYEVSAIVYPGARAMLLYPFQQDHIQAIQQEGIKQEMISSPAPILEPVVGVSKRLRLETLLLAMCIPALLLLTAFMVKRLNPIALQ